jgi:DNA-binding beta-propeller fold protein YncE
LKKIDVNDGPRGVSVIPDAQRVYVPCNEAVAIIDVEQNYKIDASGIHGVGWQGALRSDGAYIFVSTIDHEDMIIEVIDISRMEKIESIWLGEGNEYPRGIAIKPLLSSGRVSTSITCLGQENVELNTTIEISGSISPPLPGRKVNLIYKHPDVSVPISREVTTDSNGFYIDSYLPQRRGKWMVTASWEGDEEYVGSSSPILSFSVGGGGSSNDAGPLPLLIIIVVLIVVVLVLRRRGRKNT